MADTSDDVCVRKLQQGDFDKGAPPPSNSQNFTSIAPSLQEVPAGYLSDSPFENVEFRVPAAVSSAYNRG